MTHKAVFLILPSRKMNYPAGILVCYHDHGICPHPGLNSEMPGSVPDSDVLKMRS
ncbi:MAG: hypothetical protein U9M96_06290 [Thermodesulfobacteriota bacterium]|nr:hypothetical protein [Thermodesulfobacteriota bacterium]